LNAIIDDAPAPAPTHAVINGQLYRHFNAKRSPKTGRPFKKVQPGDIEREAYDRETGHHLHWRPCFREAYGDRKAFRVWDDENRERPGDGEYVLTDLGEFEPVGEV
jgi:hypothetical protein